MKIFLAVSFTLIPLLIIYLTNKIKDEYAFCIVFILALLFYVNTFNISVSLFMSLNSITLNNYLIITLFILPIYYVGRGIYNRIVK